MNSNDSVIKNVTKAELFQILKEKSENNFRLAQICATAYEGYNEIIYSVAKNYELENYRIELKLDEEIDSVSDLFPAANLYENEIKELWGVKVTGLSLDYKNRFYRIEKETPFKKQIKVIKKEGEA